MAKYNHILPFMCPYVRYVELNAKAEDKDIVERLF